MSPLLISHILIALVTPALATAAHFRPSVTLLRLSYAAASLTLATGVVLTVLHPAQLLQTCLTGILYFSAVTVLTLSARRKLLASQAPAA